MKLPVAWRLLKYRPYNAFENMAIDEAVFRETIKNKQPPTLRFFGWRPAAVSIGYFQDLKSEINVDRCAATGVDVVRRMTGGKGVYHGNELTYSLAADKSCVIFPDDIVRTYEIISLCLARGLSSLGINAVLADAVSFGKKSARSACCFSVPSGNELLVEGRKICGSAQLRTRGGFLQHGSLLLTIDPETSASLIKPETIDESPELLRRCATAVNDWLTSPVSVETLGEILQKGFSEELGVVFFEGSLTDAEQSLRDQLVKKYAGAAWNRERKKEAFKPDEVVKSLNCPVLSW